MPATLQTGAPYRASISPTRIDHYPYVNSMGGSNDSYGGYGRQGAPTNSTSKNPNSMYSAMSIMIKEQNPILQNEQKTTKSKKAAQPSPRPSTPHSKNRNFVEHNKQLKNVPNKTTPVKKSREDSPPSSPTPGSKQKSSGSSSQSSTRSTTPHEKKSVVQPKSIIKVDNKKKNDGVSSRTQSAHSRSHVRSTSPPTPTTPTAHSRSHVRAISPPASTANPTNPRSHVRAPSPESALRELRELREENRKLRRRLADQDDSLRERDSELLEYEDIVDAFQERIRQCEARNRELQQENELMRNYIEKVKSETSANEPTKLISSVMSNVQRIRGESTSPNPSTPSTPTLSAMTSSAGVNSKSPSPIPPNSPALTILKSKELSKANNLNKVVAQARGNLVVKEVETSVEKKDHPPRPTAPSPAAMNRHEPSMYTETRDRQALGLMRKQTAALNAVMEESEDSDEVDEFIFEHDDASDDHADSEFDASSSESENEGEENDDDDDDGNGMTDDHHNDDMENGDDDDVHDGDEEPVNTGFNLGNKHNLCAIVEEDDDDEDDEFECFPPQNLKNRFPVNSAESLKSSHRRVDRRLRVDSNDSSDSGIGSAHEEMSEVNSAQKQQRSPPPHQEYFSSGQHRDSMSSVNSDSSDDSTTFSSQNNSYSSTATTPPSTQSLKQNLASSNGLYGQSSSAVSDVSSSKMMVSNTFKTSSAQSNNNENSLQQSVNSAFNNVKNLVTSQRSSSPNLKQSQPVNLRSTSPTSASSSRASTPNSNASTARANSPTSSNSSRSSTPSESSRNASGYKSRANETYETSNKRSTAIPPPIPPPPPTNDKEPFATLQHYLRLISESSIVEDPLKSFNIKKVIDEGSSAKVYNAHPLSNPEEECAIKIVPLSYSLEFIFNEIYVLKNLKHKNIVDCKESFLRWDGKTREVWIAMEKCARGDVTSRAGKISQREVGRIAGELLSALKHLHSHGIIHRDIKLSNILATANNEIKLADFGISSLTPTSTTAMVGTIPYMAPDVVLVGADRPYDTKVDIWAVGVCILELLTGKAAWGRIRDDEIMDKLRRGEMPYGFHRLRKKADIGWEAIDFLEKCFARTPENRWSAEKLLEHPFITGNRN